MKLNELGTVRSRLVIACKLVRPTDLNHAALPYQALNLRSIQFPYGRCPLLYLAKQSRYISYNIDFSSIGLAHSKERNKRYARKKVQEK